MSPEIAQLSDQVGELMVRFRTIDEMLRGGAGQHGLVGRTVVIEKELVEVGGKLDRIIEDIRGDGSSDKLGLRAETSSLRSDVETLKAFRAEAIGWLVKIGLAGIISGGIGSGAVIALSKLTGGG